MLKKGILLLTALVFAVVSHLRPVCRYELAGQAIAPGCGLRASLLAERTARAAAEEILRGEAAPSPLKRSLRLSLRRPAGDARRLSDALLRNTVGVVLRDEVRVDGRRLGWVRDGEALRDELTRYIRSTLPACLHPRRLPHRSAGHAPAHHRRRPGVLLRPDRPLRQGVAKGAM